LYFSSAFEAISARPDTDSAVMAKYQPPDSQSPFVTVSSNGYFAPPARSASLRFSPARYFVSIVFVRHFGFHIRFSPLFSLAIVIFLAFSSGHFFSSPLLIDSYLSRFSPRRQPTFAIITIHYEIAFSLMITFADFLEASYY